jgi:PAS domain S-box-containing protein
MTEGDVLGPLLECLPDAVVVADKHGRIVHFNSSATRLLGWSTTEAMERLRTPDLYADPADARAVMVRLRQRTSGMPGAAEPMEVDLRTRNGSHVPVRLTAAWVRDNAGGIGTVGVFTDCRPTRAAEQRLRTATELVAARERSPDSAQLATRLATELAQPLTTALAQLDMLLETGALADPAESRVLQALEQLERVRAIVHDLTHLGTHKKAER